jgi:hypothetical protein
MKQVYPVLAYSYLRFSHSEQSHGDSIRRQVALRDTRMNRQGIQDGTQVGDVRVRLGQVLPPVPDVQIEGQDQFIPLPRRVLRGHGDRRAYPSGTPKSLTS